MFNIIPFQEFNGNFDSHTVVGNDVKPPIIAKFIRINPREWRSHISLRAEFYGCDSGNNNNNSNSNSNNNDNNNDNNNNSNNNSNSN